jgi:hypothetical protein
VAFGRLERIITVLSAILCRLKCTPLGLCLLSRRHVIVKLKILPVKRRRYISRLLASLQFTVIGPKDPILDLLAALGIDRMGDIRMKLHSIRIIALPIGVPVSELEVPIVAQALATMIAISGPQVVLFVAGWAVVGDFSRGHGQKQAFISVDQLHVTDDKYVIEG